MISPKITSVFYDANLLPFKDSARTIHYPLTGGTFAGSHNTKQIRFYVRDIGGTTNITWVVLSKLPNGKLGYEICSNVAYDEELGEYYLLFDLSAYYTSVKGDLYLSLRGYQGDIEFTNLDEQGNPLAGNVYNIVGDPLIEVTGTIKLSINYSPMVNTGTQLLPSDVDKVLAALSNYLKLENAVIFTHDITTLNASDYDVGQLLLEYKNNLANLYYVAEVSQTKVFYFATFDTLRSNEVRTLTISAVQTINLLLGGKIEKSGNDILITNNSHTLKLDVNGVLTLDNDVLLTQTSGDNRYIRKYQEPINGTITLLMLYALFGNKPIYFSYDDNWYFCRLEEGNFLSIKFEFENTINKGRYVGSASQSTTLSSILNSSSQYYQPYATEDYVDSALQEFLQKEYDKVDTTEYPTLNDFLASTGEEGYIYLYPIDTSDDTKGYYQYIWENNAWVSLGSTQIDLSGYVEKTTSANKVYGTNELGGQTTYTVDDFYEGNIARRDTDGSITVPLTPTQNGHASSKKYVDDEVNDLSNEVYTKTEVDDKLEEKANVDGNYPTLTAGLADNFTPYSEDSGAEQDNPFISNGTGTNNNTEIVTVGDYGLLQEKQGNTLVVNQYAREINSTNYFSNNGSATFSDNVATFTASANGGYLFTSIYPATISGHKYLAIGEIKLTTATTSVKFGSWISNSSYVNTIATTNWQSLAVVITSGGTNGNITVTDGRASDWDAIQVRNIACIDLTQMFNGDSDIIDDITANPDHFSWYYNGSLDYNTGSLENANGVKLVSTGRNLFNLATIESGKSISANGTLSNDANWSTSDYIIISPNTTYYFKDVASSSQRYACAWYDENKNFIKTRNIYDASNHASGTATSPSNARYVRITTHNDYVDKCCVSIYYTPEQGYDKYYPYEEPYVVDTGNEVLRSAGSVKDYKEPNGTIHRLVGNRAYQSGDENDSSLLTDGTTTNYPLETPNPPEQGTPFAENLPINDYGMLYWLDENDNLVGIPQGAKIFYPVNYKGFVDDMYSRVDGDSSDYALNSELNAKFETYLKSLSGFDATATQVLKNVEGTLTWVTEE